ncbi:unnamed protein product [Gadus morhua 'NCC']
MASQETGDFRGTQGLKVQRVALDTEAPKGQMVVLVTMVLSVTQETLGHGGSLEIKAQQGQPVNQESPASRVRPPLASCWSSTASLRWCRSAHRETNSSGWATAWCSWRDRRKPTRRT